MTTPIRLHAEVRARFLAALRRYGTVERALRATGTAKTTVYALRRDDPAFAKMWDAVIGAPADRLEAALIARAIKGVARRKKFANGTVETWRDYNDTLAMFLLKKGRPEVYGDAPAAPIDRAALVASLEALRIDTVAAEAEADVMDAA